MIFSPEEAYKNGWIDFVDPANIQQNGIDLRIKKVFAIETVTNNLIVPSMKSAPMHIELNPRNYHIPEVPDFPFKEYWRIHGNAVSIETYEYVRLPAHVCAVIYTRSTPNRSHAFAVSGLYDSGFAGHVCFSFYPQTPDMEFLLGKGDSSLAQIVFIKADSASMYDGVYKDKKK